MVRECEYCGEEYTPASNARKTQRFCKPACRHAWRYRNVTYTFVCTHCGKEYEAKEPDRDQYCSKECAYADIQAWHGAIIPVECSVCGREYTRSEGHNETYCSKDCRDKAYTRECTICGTAFVAATSLSSRCGSDKCEKEYARRWHVERYVPAVEKNELVTKVCAYCGDTFETNFHSERIYCPDKNCGDRAVKLTRRHRKRMAKPSGARRVYRAHVFERDEWTCQLCGKAVNRNLNHPHPMSASLDHIIPLARGGLHVPSNCQLAHLACNSKKRDLLPMELEAIYG